MNLPEKSQGVALSRTCHVMHPGDAFLRRTIAQEALRSGDVAAAMSAQCALENSCLVFWETTTAQEALEAFESTGRTVGVLQVLGDSSAYSCRLLTGQLNALFLESIMLRTRGSILGDDNRSSRQCRVVV